MSRRVLAVVGDSIRFEVVLEGDRVLDFQEGSDFLIFKAGVITPEVFLRVGVDKKLLESFNNRVGVLLLIHEPGMGGGGVSTKWQMVVYEGDELIYHAYATGLMESLADIFDANGLFVDCALMMTRDVFMKIKNSEADLEIIEYIYFGDLLIN